MPLNNSDFGNKFVYLGLNNFDDVEWIDLDSNAIKIFFPKMGKNHPYPSGAQADTPNWYYYWGQDVLPPETLTARIYKDEWSHGDNVMEWEPSLDGTSRIYVYNGASVRPDGDWRLSDYHYCTSKFAHENQHERDWRNEVWAGNPYNPQEDIDQNFLMDYWELNEPAMLPCKSPEDRYNIYYRKWTEQRAKIVEDNYPDKSSTNDWAFPGYNYK
jgi:hypothetical protein